MTTLDRRLFVLKTVLDKESSQMSDAAIEVKSEAVGRRQLQLPLGVDVARFIDGMREICMYYINTDTMRARWDILYECMQYYVVLDYPIDGEWSIQAFNHWLAKERPRIKSALIDHIMGAK